jgi:hypothetical protein
MKPERMQVFRTIDEVRQWRREAVGSVGLVPTMGALHEGHLTLVRRAIHENGRVGVSIFVNPRQFGEGEDFSRYPRTLERDLDLLASESVDAVLVPDAAEMYPADARTRVLVSEISERLEGAAIEREALLVVAHPVRARLELGQRLLGPSRIEGEIILEEVVVAVNMRDRQDLQAERVVAHQIGKAGVRVDDHLVRQPGDAVVVHGLGLLEALAVAPMRVVRRHAVIGHVAEHVLVVADLELLLVAVEAEIPHALADHRVPVFQVLDRPARHGESPCVVAYGL